MSASPVRNLRRKRLIKPQFQLRLILVFFAIAAVGGLIQAILLNLALGELAGHSSEEIQLLRQVPGLVQRNLMLTFAIQVPLFLVVGIGVTFRIAGPLFSIERYLGRVAKGENPGSCHVRKNDELHDLCDLVNGAVTRLRSEESDSAAGTERTRPAGGVAPHAASPMSSSL